MSTYPANTTNPKKGSDKYLWNWLGSSIKKFAEALSSYLPLPTTPTLQEVLTAGHDLTSNRNFQGTGAGVGNTGIDVNGFGADAANANVSNEVNAMGNWAAKGNKGIGVNAFGTNAALGNGYMTPSGAGNINCFGVYSAYLNNGSNVNALGLYSARQNEGNHVNALGYNSAYINTGNHINAFGENAGQNNTQSNRTIFSNASLPSFVDRPAAIAAISTAPGASPSCTYLYYNSTTGAVEAIRIP